MFTTIGGIMRANRDRGDHFFDADTMRFFKSRVLDGIYPTPDGGALFVTSERGFWEGAVRKYTVRRANPDGSIDTMDHYDGFQKHRTAASARKEARESVVKFGR